MQTRNHRIPASRSRPLGLALLALVALACLVLGLSQRPDPAGATTAAEARAELGQISNSITQLKADIAGDNRRIAGLIGRLSDLRVEAGRLGDQLAASQARVDRIEADLERERRHLREVRARYQRSLAVLRRQLVSMYMTGPPQVSAMVFASEDFSGLVSNSTYAASIQDGGEEVIERVRGLRDEITRTVARMEIREKKLQQVRDQIAVEEEKARAARDEVEAQRAEFIAARQTRRARIDALEARAGRLEDSLPDLSSDPASSSAPAAAPPVPGQRAKLLSNGLASPPAGAPVAVQRVIQAANRIADKPYLWGGGHGSFESSGYDCSGAVSYALNGGGLLSSPLDSTGLTTWGEPGTGNWITVYGNAGHVYMVVAGLRWDTSNTGGTGPSWHTAMRSSSGFIPRHPKGL